MEHNSASSAFCALDTNSDGVLDKSELAMGLLSAGTDPNELSELFMRLDTNADGAVTLKEFEAGFNMYKSSRNHAGYSAVHPLALPSPGLFGQDKLKEAFDHFDLDRSGGIELKELQAFFNFFGHEPEPQLLRQYFDGYDVDKDGVISYKEMKQVLESMSADIEPLIEQLRQVFINLDRDQDGRVSKLEAECAIKAVSNIPGFDYVRIAEAFSNNDTILTYECLGRLVFGAGIHGRTGLNAMLTACCVHQMHNMHTPVVAQLKQQCDPGQLEAAKATITIIEQHCKLKVVWKLPVVQHHVKSAPCSEQMLVLFAPVLKEEMLQYPSELFQSTWIQQLTVCTGLTLNGVPVGGAADQTRQNLWLNADAAFQCGSSEPSVTVFRQVLHHELFHLMDWKLGQIRGATNPNTQDQEWMATNPPNFTYVHQRPSKKGGKLGYGDLYGYSLTPGSGPIGFLNSYQTASMAEDKGCLYGDMFAYPQELAAACKDDMLLRNKVMLLRATIHKFCPNMGAKFWLRMKNRALQS